MNPILENPSKNSAFAGLLGTVRGLKFKRVEFDCPVHGKQVYEVPETSINAPKCPVCALEESARQKRLEDAKADSRSRERELINLLHPAVVDSDLMTFGAFFPETENAEKALAITRRFAKNFTTREAVRIEKQNVQDAKFVKVNSIGLLLYGNSGCGKTHLANAICSELKEQGWGSMMLTASELIFKFQSVYRYEEKTRIANLLSMIPVLVIDELGRQRGTDAGSEFLWNVINDRVRLGRPLILITNHSGEEVKQMVDTSVFDRLRSATFPILFDWISHRKTVAKTVDPMSIF